MTGFRTAAKPGTQHFQFASKHSEQSFSFCFVFLLGGNNLDVDWNYTMPNLIVTKPIDSSVQLQLIPR